MTTSMLASNLQVPAGDRVPHAERPPAPAVPPAPPDLVIAWPCTCRSAAHRSSSAASLERIALVLALENLGEPVSEAPPPPSASSRGASASHRAHSGSTRSRCSLECWLERSDRRAQTIVERTMVDCLVNSQAGLLHIDVEDCGVAGRLLALTIAPQNGSPPRLLYARTSLLAHAGFRAAGHDAPCLR